MTAPVSGQLVVGPTSRLVGCSGLEPCMQAGGFAPEELAGTKSNQKLQARKPEETNQPGQLLIPVCGRPIAIVAFRSDNMVRAQEAGED